MLLTPNFVLHPLYAYLPYILPTNPADTHKMPAHLRRACVLVCRLRYHPLQTYGLHHAYHARAIPQLLITDHSSLLTAQLQICIP